MAVFGGSGGSATVSSDFRVYTFNPKNLQQKIRSAIIKLSLIWPENVNNSAENEGNRWELGFCRRSFIFRSRHIQFCEFKNKLAPYHQKCASQNVKFNNSPPPHNP